MITEYRKRAFARGNGLRWPVRLRLLLILPVSCRWNAWVRDWTARLEGFKSYEHESTEGSVPTWVGRVAFYVAVIVGVIVARWIVNGRPW